MTAITYQRSEGAHVIALGSFDLDMSAPPQALMAQIKNVILTNMDPHERSRHRRFIRRNNPAYGIGLSSVEIVIYQGTQTDNEIVTYWLVTNDKAERDKLRRAFDGHVAPTAAGPFGEPKGIKQIVRETEAFLQGERRESAPPQAAIADTTSQLIAAKALLAMLEVPDWIKETEHWRTVYNDCGTKY